MKFSLLQLIAFSFTIFIPHANAQNEVSYDRTTNKVIYCKISQKCKEMTVPASLLDDLIDNELRIETFADKKQYLLLTPKRNYSANICYTTYLIQNDRILEEPVSILENAELCLYRFIDDRKLINRYRDGATWYESVYQYNDGYYKLVLVDKCIDCQRTFRTYFDGKKSRKVIVSSSLFYENRHPVTATVTQSKAYLYHAPMQSAQSQKYLVDGDRITLLDEQYQESTDTWWYFMSFEQSNHRVVLMWVKSNDVVL